MGSVSFYKPTKRQILKGLAASALGLAGGGKALAIQAGVTVRINYYDTYAPFSYRDDRSRLVGLLIDAHELIAQRGLGWRIIHRGLPWARAQEEVMKGQADAYCTVPTDLRREYALFAQSPIVKAPIAIFTRRNHPRRQEMMELASFDAVKVFTHGDFIGNGWSRQHFNPGYIEWSGDYATVLRKIALGRLDLTINSLPVTWYLAKTLGIAGELEAIPFAAGGSQDFHFGLRKSHPQAEALIKDFEAAQEICEKDGSLVSIVEPYVKF